MSLYTISPSDKFPSLRRPAGLTIEESSDPLLLSVLGNITVAEATRRMANDHLAFVASINHYPAAFGWMARGKATIGELNHELILPVGHRYLWNFRTASEYRGLGIYPALLQYIVRYESTKAERFWIIHAPENRASLSGITKAGFKYVGKLYPDSAGGIAIEGNSAPEIEEELLLSMGFLPSSEKAASCWNCSSPFLKKRSSECCCQATGTVCTHSRQLMLA
jgi:hypothetical protein